MFGKYHKFKDCERLQATIKDLCSNGHIPENIYTNYCRYHFSVLQKLRAAKESFEKLSEFISEPDAATTAFNYPEEFLFGVNFWLDNFLHFCGSALDVFARDVLCYFDLIPIPPANVYFSTAREELQSGNSSHSLLPKLQDPSWLPEFMEYRNCSTHEEVITDVIDIEAVSIALERKVTVDLILPDNPHSYPRTYRRKIVLIKYCEKTFSRILRLFHPVYTVLNNLIIANGSLPLPP